jgi:hypothetical protein
MTEAEAKQKACPTCGLLPSPAADLARVAGSIVRAIERAAHGGKLTKDQNLELRLARTNALGLQALFVDLAVELAAKGK